MSTATESYVGVIAHECSTCQGTGAFSLGAEYERNGNVYWNEERCPTCGGEGLIYEPTDEDGVDEQIWCPGGGSYTTQDRPKPTADHPITSAYRERRNV